MKKLLTKLIIVCATAILALPGLFMEPQVLSGANSNIGWFPMINLNHNAYLMWRTDYVNVASEWLLSSAHSRNEPFTPLAILFIGTLLVVKRLSGDRPMSSALLWLSSMLPPLILLDTVGIDPLVLGTIAWIPALAILSSHLGGPSPRASAWILLGLLSLQNCLSANQVALISAMCALSLSALFSRKDETFSHSKYNRMAILALIAIPALVTTVTAPQPPVPDYPKGAHVVPENDAIGVVQPLVGPAYPFEAMHREDARNLYKPVALYLGGVAAVAFMLARVTSRGPIRVLASTALTLSAFAILDTFPPESLSIIAPLASISRLVPWASTYSLTSVCVGLVAWILGVVLVILPTRIIAWPVAIVSIFTLSLTSSELFNPFLRQYTSTEDRALKRVLSSPSAAVVRHFAYNHPNLAQDLASVRSLSRQASVEASELHAEVKISPEQSSQPTEPLKAERYWRWSTRRGKQLGDELLTIKFPQPVSLRGLELDPGTYTTDFPRGLEISGGECDQNAARKIFSTPSWQGSLAFTPRGFPYLTPRNQVKVLFNRQETVSCLFARQTGQASFDWSISRVRVIQ